MWILLCGPGQAQCSLWAPISPQVSVQAGLGVGGSAGAPAASASLVSGLDSGVGGKHACDWPGWGCVLCVS